MSVTPSPLRRALVALLVAALGASAALTATSAAVAAPAAPTILDPAIEEGTVDNFYDVQVGINDLLAAENGGFGRVIAYGSDDAVVTMCDSEPFTYDNVISASFECQLTGLTPGVYRLVAQQSDVLVPGPSDWSPESDSVTLIVGTAAPATIASPTGGTLTSLGITLSGTGPALGTVDVDVEYNASGTFDPFCPDVPVSVTGQWTCTAAAVQFGPLQFSVIGTYADNDGPVAYEDTRAVEIVPTASAVDFTIGPGTARIVTTANPGADNLLAELYRITLNDDPFEPYLFGSPVSTCTGVDEPLVVDCERTLEPGIWSFYVRENVAEETLEMDHFILVPEAPTTFAAAVTPSRTVQFSGTGEPGFLIEVTDADTLVEACTATVSASGTWQCTAQPPAGTFPFQAAQRSVGFVATPPDFIGLFTSTNGLSVRTDAVTVTVPPAPPAPAPVPTLVPTPAPVAWTLEGYDGSPLRPGQVLDLSARGLPPQTAVMVEIRSTPQLLGTAVADDLGVFALTVTVPENLEPGPHTLVAIATPPGGVPSTLEFPVTVLAAEETAAEEEVVEPVAAPPADSDPRAALAGPADRSDPAAPSAITSSIPTLMRIFEEPWVIGAASGLALALLLLVAFPAELLTSTLSANTGRLGRWFVALERRTDQVTEWFTRVSRTRALAAAVLVGLTSLIFGFVDPEFGFDPVSIRMTVSLAIGLFLITYVAAWIAGAIARRAWGVDTEVTLQPVALLFAVIGVVVARILEFSPGFLIGLVIGLDLISRVEPRVRARVVLLSTGVVVGVALAAWFAFSALTALSTGQPGWVELLISDTLVATTAEGLTAALAALLPLGFLAGYDVFRYSKPLWGVSFLVTGTLFALIVLPTAAGETADVADVGFWMLVMAIFAAVTMTLWALLHFTGNGSRDGDDEGAEQDAAPATAAR